MPPNGESNPKPTTSTTGIPSIEHDQAIDLRDVGRRLGRGLSQTIGLALLGLAIAAAAWLGVCSFLPISTSTRVIFSFPGFGKGQYPDGSKFTPNDLTAPDVIDEAIKGASLDAFSGFESKIRAALSVEGIISADETKSRDRLRATGQTPPPYTPDEYEVALTLPRKFPLSNGQRSILLNGIINAYREKFERSYVDVPLAFGSVFQNVGNADYFEYERVLYDEIQNITAYLNQQLAQAKNFRSPTTNLSFSDLLDQTDVFSQIRLNETLGLIRQSGLSRDRKLALIKMDYYLHTLEDQEQKAIEDQKVIQGLLAQAQDHAQSYVLGIKSQAAQPRSENPLLDQGLIDSLLANDSYNFLVRKALDAGLEVKKIQAEKAQLLERRKSMESFLPDSHEDRSGLIVQVQKSLGELQSAYKELVTNIRKTQVDFAHQQFADAIRLSDAIRTEGMLRPLVKVSAVGLFLGAALGMGLSLLGLYVGESGRRKVESGNGAT